MKIKTKLTLGVGLLFLMIVILTTVGTLYINALKNDTILEPNYITIEYSRAMMVTLDEMLYDTQAFLRFKEYLNKQQDNISEPMEREATQQLVAHFSKLKYQSRDSVEALHRLMRKDIAEIMNINTQAIKIKSLQAKKTASSATVWISITGTVCFLIAFSLLLNLPNNITDPIKELSQSIQKIAQKRYEQRVNFEAHEEFGELAKSFNSMAQKLEEYDSNTMSKLLFEKKRIDTLINNMHDPVIGLDENQRFLFANHQALKILGLRLEELLGRELKEIAASKELIHTLMHDLQAPLPKENQSSIIKVISGQKESYYDKELLHITLIPTGEKEEVSAGTVIILNNVTPFKELDAAKTHFIATVSHELKTPIASIKMCLSLLEKGHVGNLNEEQKQLLDSIKEDSNRLLKITGELLNMTQVETGNIHLNLQQSSPYDILSYAIEAVKLQALQYQVDIQLETEAQLPLVQADPDKTAWVLINFLTNAIRYAPGQNIVVKATKEHNNVCFAVIDHGQGIDSRYKEKIFDRYFQIPGSSKSGTGLGLAISKEFIQAQGGDIGVVSEIGQGCTFYFKLLACT